MTEADVWSSHKDLKTTAVCTRQWTRQSNCSFLWEVSWVLGVHHKQNKKASVYCLGYVTLHPVKTTSLIIMGSIVFYRIAPFIQDAGM